MAPDLAPLDRLTPIYLRKPDAKPQADKALAEDAAVKPGSVEHISILWAGPEHAGELGRLHAPLFSPAWDVGAFKLLLDHPGSTAFMARAGEPLESIGFIVGRLGRG